MVKLYKEIEGYTPIHCDEYVSSRKKLGYTAHFYDAYSALLANHKTLTIFIYCEHAVNVKRFANKVGFDASLAESIAWYNTEYAA